VECGDGCCPAGDQCDMAASKCLRVVYSCPDDSPIACPDGGCCPTGTTCADGGRCRVN
jgi:hypothetical protein